MNKHLFSAIRAVILVTAVVAVLSSCGVTRDTSYVEDHRIATMIDRMDSVIGSRQSVQQDSTWRELVLRQFQSIREKSDTSHHVVVDSTGRVIKETLVINNVREVTSETDRQELQVMSHRIEVMDSTISVMSRQLERSDSLLRSQKKTEVRTVTTPLSLWDRIRIWTGSIALLVLALGGAVWLFIKKIWWQ